MKSKLVAAALIFALGAGSASLVGCSDTPTLGEVLPALQAHERTLQKLREFGRYMQQRFGIDPEANPRAARLWKSLWREYERTTDASLETLRELLKAAGYDPEKLEQGEGLEESRYDPDAEDPRRPGHSNAQYFAGEPI